MDQLVLSIFSHANIAVLNFSNSKPLTTMKIIYSKSINLCPHTNAMEFHRCVKCMDVVGCPRCTGRCDQCKKHVCNKCNENPKGTLSCGSCKKPCCDQCPKCPTCDKPICNDWECKKYCEVYGCDTRICTSHGAVCVEHSFKCEGCEKDYFGKTDCYGGLVPTPCESCGKKLCPECVTQCQFKYEYPDTRNKEFKMEWVTKAMKALDKYSYEYDGGDKEYYDEECKAMICKRGPCAKSHCTKYTDWRDRRQSVALCDNHTNVPASLFGVLDIN